MNQRIFVIKDHKAQIWKQPFYSQTVTEAERAFIDVLNDQDSTIAKYPKDFSLYTLGTFDTLNGTFETTDPVLICDALDHVKQPPLGEVC